MSQRNPDGTPFIYEGPRISIITQLYQDWKNGKYPNGLDEGDLLTVKTFHSKIGGTAAALKVLGITEAEYNSFIATSK